MAKKIIETLITELALDGAKHSRGLDDNLRKTKAWGNEVGNIHRSVAGAIGGVAALVGGGISFARFISETKAAEQEQAQLSAVLKSTGNAAGFSRDQLNDMADQMESLTSFSGGEFTEAQTSLLAFTGIVGEQFPRALSAAADMAARTGVSVKQASETIGRALDVPSKGMAALSKQGFRFSEDQKKVIQELERTGRTAEAQGIILKALEETYGGAAAAARDTFVGSLDALGNTIDGLLTGEGSLDAAKGAINDLNSLLSDPATREGIAQLTSGLIGAGTELVNFLSGVGSFSAWFGETAAAVFNGISPEDVVRLEDRAKQLQARMNGLKSWFLDGGNSDLFRSNAELQKELDLVNKMISDFYARQDLVSRKSSAPTVPNSAPPPVKLFEEYNVSQILEDFDTATKAQVDAYNKIQAAFSAQESSYLRQIKLTGDVTEAERLRFELSDGSLKNISAGQAKRLQDMAAEIDAQKLLVEGEKAVIELRKEFASIHEQAIESSGKLIDLEDYRSKKQRDALEAEIQAIKDKGVWTAELEAEAHAAREEQELAHQSRLKNIKDQAEADELKRHQVQLAGAQTLFSSLGDLTEAFGEKNSRLRKVFLIAEKAAAIASATLAIQTGIAEAGKLAFPANLVAMGTVAAQTAGILTTIKGVNIAHGGLDYVQKESTYLLDKGERVISPLQNRDLTEFLRSPSGSGVTRVEVINNIPGVTMQATAEQDGERMRLILTAVDNKLREDLGRGGGVWGEAKKKFGWATKGAIG